MSIGSKVIWREWWHEHVSISILFIIKEESRLEIVSKQLLMAWTVTYHTVMADTWKISQQNYEVSTSVLYINAYV